jgi:hypothetical protein
VVIPKGRSGGPGRAGAALAERAHEQDAEAGIVRSASRWAGLSGMAVSPAPRLMRSRRLTAHSSAPRPAQMIFAYLLCVSAGRSPVVRIVPFVDRVIRSTSPGSMTMKRPT